jgi:hypothetical protein
MRTRLLAALIVAFAVVAPSLAHAPQATPPARGGIARAAKIDTPLREAAAAIDTWRANLPQPLRGLSPAQLERRWPRWIRERDREIRARVAQGDQDSVVNLWLYGTSFTDLPRAVEPDMSRAAGLTAQAIVTGRLDDLLDGFVDPGANARLQFARDVVERHGLNPASAAERGRIRGLLAEWRARMIAEFQEYERALRSAEQAGDPSEVLSTHAVLFRDRGLSTDTSVLVNFAVDEAIGAMARSGTIVPGGVRRVGIVGPGLEMTNKADGQDFYPPQTLQPFALMDSLISRALADPRQLRVTTFDVSPRVNQHLEGARRRAESGQPYSLHLALADDEPWRSELVAFTKRVGVSIGESARPVAVPPTAGAVNVRAVQVRPAAVLAIDPADVNVIVERLAPLPANELFDLIVATNILVYYSRFEQALAMTNLAGMLKPGGILLTNSAVFPVPPFKASAQQLRVVYSDRQYDQVFWYERE